MQVRLLGISGFSAVAAMTSLEDCARQDIVPPVQLHCN